MKFDFSWKSLHISWTIITTSVVGWCKMPPLANVNWSAFPKCFFKLTTGEMVPMVGSKAAVGDLILL